MQKIPSTEPFTSKEVGCCKRLVPACALVCEAEEG